jgi:hypothetical protein
MATAAPALEAAPAPAPAPVDDPNVYTFELEGFVPSVSLNLASIPQEIRMHLLKSAVRAYVANRVSTAAAKVKKENEPWDRYDAAVKNDPLQSIVPAPTEPRATADYPSIAAGAVTALYEGNIGRRTPGGKAKELRDPLVTQITKAVIAEVYEKGRAADPKYKYPTAMKEVGSDGLAYLKAKIAEKVAAGADAAALNAFLEQRYVKPARIMLGLDTPGKLKDADGIL